MAKWHRLLAVGAAGLALAGAASGASGEAPVWGLANSFAGLPLEVRTYLTDSTAVADQGDLFNGSCFVEPGVPTTRFMLAAVSAGETIVAIQHGGRAPGITTQAFRQENGHWKAMERGSVGPGVILMTARILVGQHRDSTRPPQPR